MVVEIVHGEVKEHTIVALPAFPSIPPTANARFAVGGGGGIPGPFELVPILTRVLTAEVADSLPLDVHAHRHRIVGIVILKYEASFNKPILTLVRTRAADRLKSLLIVRLADDRQRELAGTPQMSSHALRRATRWRLAEAEETTEEPHCPSSAWKCPLAASLEFNRGRARHPRAL